MCARRAFAFEGDPRGPGRLLCTLHPPLIFDLVSVPGAYNLSIPCVTFTLHTMPEITLTPADLERILVFTQALALRAGALILEGSRAILATGNVNEKKNEVDLVTEYDVRVEELVKGELGKEYKGFKL